MVGTHELGSILSVTLHSPQSALDGLPRQTLPIPMKDRLTFILLGAAIGAAAVLLLAQRFTIQSGQVGGVTIWMKIDRLTGRTWQHVPSWGDWRELTNKETAAE